MNESCHLVIGAWVTPIAPGHTAICRGGPRRDRPLPLHESDFLDLTRSQPSPEDGASKSPPRVMGVTTDDGRLRMVEIIATSLALTCVLSESVGPPARMARRLDDGFCHGLVRRRVTYAGGCVDLAV